MNTNLLKIKLQKAQLANEDKQILLSAVDSFGEAFANFLSNKIDKFGFEMEKKYILQFVQEAQLAAKVLLQGDSRLYIKLLKESPENGSYDFGLYVLPIVLDIEATSDKRKFSVSPELYNVINQFKVAVFKKLPDSHLISILRSNLLFFLSQIDMVYQLKRRYVFDSADLMDDWGKEYLQALKQNEEILGSGNIMVDGKGMPPFVKNWIQDFISFLPTPVTERSALEEAQYFAKSPNLKVLSVEEKKMLQEVLQLHDWLLHPFATYEEIELAEANQNAEPKVVASSVPPQLRSVPNVQDMLQNKDQRRGFGDITKNVGVINPARTPARQEASATSPTMQPTPQSQSAEPRPPLNPEIERKLAQLRSRVNKSS